MDRLQPSDIERSRSELADLERRFLERVAMTNRCKTAGEIGGQLSGQGCCCCCCCCFFFLHCYTVVVQRPSAFAADSTVLRNDFTLPH